MAQVQLVVGGRHYRVACQDGGEAHLERLAVQIDAKIAEVAKSMRGLDEPRQLLFASLLLADEIGELRQSLDQVHARLDALESAPPPLPPPPAIDLAALRALERLADRVETLADGLEQQGATA